MGDDGDRAWLRRQPRQLGLDVVKLVDLFAGCGGLSLGVQEAARQLGARLDIRLVAENDEFASSTYAHNFGVADARMRGDVRKLFSSRRGGRLTDEREARTLDLVGASVDLLVGGPPCQGHSTLNNHTRGDDPKNDLYMAMARAAEVLEPTAVLIENVPAVERAASKVVERAWARLEAAGYFVDAAIVNMLDIGVAQTRRRHVLLAHRRVKPNLRAAVEAARVSKQRTLAWALQGTKYVEGALFYGAPELSERNLERAKLLRRRKAYDLPELMRPPCQKGPHKYKSMYGRLRWDSPAQTITSGYGSPGQGRYFHPAELRALTAHEASRLQFFPDWFDFSKLPHRTALSTAIGNAVPPKLGFVLAHHLLTL